MDDTQQSCASDAGATRKRRSSILKSQRPPRTPFSELEFNVATPTDTAKSRRVSFSKRTGVAEFVTNEATTTWKNFYEEHNKSLELSGNESGAKATREPIGHIGKRIFEQQFEEVEAVDFITSLDNLAGRHINTTLNVNLTDQLASLEYTDNKLTAPQNNFELSAFTDHHSKLFGDDLAVPVIGEMSGRIDVNFSTVQSIDVKDDLDEIQRDIQRQSNVVGPVPFRDARDFSEYIEVELNSTHAVIRNEESDMSVTETIPSPKVNVSKTLSSDKKSSLNWVDNKENNYLGDLDKAKSVILDVNADMSITTALPSKVNQVPEIKTLSYSEVLANLSMTKPRPDKLTAEFDVKTKTVIFDGNADMSITAGLPLKVSQESKSRTIIFNDDLADLSMTRALPAKLQVDDKERNHIEHSNRSKTIFDRNTDMSITEVLPSNVKQEPEKRRTMIFDDDLGDLSMTKPIPAKLLSAHSEILNKSNLNVCNTSNLQYKNNTSEAHKTMLFEDDFGDLSITKPVPAKLLSVHSEIIDKSNALTTERTAEKRRTILFKDDLDDLSMTKPIPAKLLSMRSEIIDKSNFNDNFNNIRGQITENTTEKRKTILFEDELGDLSMTKPIPAKLMAIHSEIIDKSNFNDKNNDIGASLKENTTEKRKTILFEDDLGDLSMTKPIPAKLLSIHSEIIDKSHYSDNVTDSNAQAKENSTEKRKTILFEGDIGDLSMTKPIPTKLPSIHSEIIDKSKFHVDTNNCNAQTLENIIERRKTILFEDNLGDLSITKPILSNLLDHFNKSNIQPKDGTTEKRKTILFEDNSGDLSMTKPIPANLLSVHSEVINKSYIHGNSNDTSLHKKIIPENKDVFQPEYKDVKNTDMFNGAAVVTSKENISENRKTILFDDDLGDLSMTKSIPDKLLSVHSQILDKSNLNDNVEKHSLRKSLTIEYDNDEKLPDMSKQCTTEKRKTILFDDSFGNLSMTKSIPAELLSSEMNKSTQNPILMNTFDIQSGEFKDTKMTDLVSLDFSNLKSQNVVVYQVATKDSSNMQNAIEQMDTSESIDKVEQGNVMSAESGAIDNKVFIVKEEKADVNEDLVLEETTLPEPHKSIEKSENMEEEKDISKNMSIDSVGKNMSTMHAVSKKSILFDLLDMSNASLTSGLDDKGVTAHITSSKPSIQDTVKTDKTETESAASDMFYITRDTDSEIQSNENREKETNSTITFVEETEKLSSDELRRDSIPVTADSIQRVLSEIEQSDKQVADSSNDKKIVNTDILGNECSEHGQNNTAVSRFRSFREADNTKELLDMISDLTSGQSSFNEDPPLPLTYEAETLPITNEHQPISNRNSIIFKDIQTNMPRRVSIAARRQSIISREDLINNISMAQAALQRSIDMTDSDTEGNTEESEVIISPPKKSLRVSHEVVKTLHFEDESTSEVSLRPETKFALRKTACEDTSIAKEGFHKANVIPSYLKDVSDGIKSLMHDLVKPMAEELPFEAVGVGKNLKKSPSTCSTQIQANLYASSQIDVTNELFSNPESLCDMERDTIANTMTVKSPVKNDLVSRNLKDAALRPIKNPPEVCPGKVLLFDHENPLNNVLLTPTEFTEVHKYCPKAESEETLNKSGSDRSHFTQCSVQDKEYDVQNVSVRYNVGNYAIGCQSGDTGAERVSTRQSFTSDISKPTSIDQSIGAVVTEVKDIEVNTTIAMKKNKELLEASSSLTLVDDALANTPPCFDIDLDAPTELHYKVNTLKVIYKLKGEGVDKDSNLISNDEADTAKAKKRIHSPSSSENCSSASKQDVTPKPNAKVQRLSDSPDTRNYSLKRISGNKCLLSENVSNPDSQMDIDISPSKDNPRKRSPKKKNSPRKGVNLTVQQLLTEFNVKTEIDHKNLDKQILEALSKTDSSTAPESISECGGSLELVSSFTSSKNQWKARPSATTTVGEMEAKSDGRCEEWGVEKAPLSDHDSSVNVVAKIDMLPFMGSNECEWASSGTDTWSFRLLHGRLRLSVRLAHRHHNAARTRVRADTPVDDVSVRHTLHHNDKRNSVAVLCIRFALESIRAACGASAGGVAGAVPDLLRRAASVARRARNWGRAMHDARMQLAYTLTDEGKLVLKVANIPLRCVWEVTMNLKLTGAANSMPWPRADNITVMRVLEREVEDEPALTRVLAAVPDGWGHVPATVWRVFKYLKNKTPEHDSLGIRTDTLCQPVS